MTYAIFENLEVGDRIAKTKFPRKIWWTVVHKEEEPEPLIKIKDSRGVKPDRILYSLHFTIYRWYKVYPRHLPPKANISKGGI